MAKARRTAAPLADRGRPLWRTNPLVWTLRVLAVIGVLAMHTVVIVTGVSQDRGPSTSQMSIGMTPAVPSRFEIIGQSAAVIVGMPMTACNSHSCVAARGAAKPAPGTVPCVTGGVCVPSAAPAGWTRAASTLMAQRPRPPPRSGSCSHLCVWRV